MPIFDLSNDDLLPVEQKNFATEKELQTLIEKKALHEQRLWGRSLTLDIQGARSAFAVRCNVSPWQDN